MDINQITISVRDFEEGVSFFSTIGFRQIVHNAEGRYARFELPSGSTTLSIHEDANANPGDVIIYLEVDEVDRRYHDLVAAGVVFHSPPKLENWRWVEARFADPTGNKFCLFHAGPDRRFPPWRLGNATSDKETVPQSRAGPKEKLRER